MKEIISKNNNLIKEIYKYKTRKQIYNNKKFLIEGKNNIARANKYDLIDTLFVKEESYSIEHPNSILVSQEILDKLKQTNDNHEAIALINLPRNYHLIKESHIEVLVDDRNYSKIVVLDNINNPGNLGSIIRSAVAFDMEAIFLVNNSVSIFNQKTIAATQGGIFDIPIYEFDFFPEELLSKYNNFVLYLDDDAKKIGELEIDMGQKNAFVFGNESRGIDKTVYNKLNAELLYIPISKKMESVSVSTAAAILFFHLYQ